MNLLSYQIALSRRDELLRQAADHRLSHLPPEKTATLSKPVRRAPLKLRRGFLPMSA